MRNPTFAKCTKTKMRRRGSTLLEFALIVPILIAILLGIMEFGWYVKNQLTIANATREGARVAATGSTQQQIKDRVVNAAKPSLTIAASDVTLALSPKANNGATYGAFPADNTGGTTPVNGAARGDFIRVTTDVAHRSLTGFPFLSNRRIIIAVTMVRE